jgi:tetratricopeptide (TPR) repeat protein
MPRKKLKRAAGKKKASRQKTTPSRPTNVNRCPAGTKNLLDKAAGLYFRKQLDKAIRLLQTLDEESSFENDNEKVRYYQLLAFAQANAGRYEDAEATALKGLEVDRNNPDFFFVLAYLSSSYKDFDKCLDYAGRFLSSYNRIENTDQAAALMSHGYIHLLYNYVGTAFNAKNNAEKAEEAFLKAIALKPSYDHPYLNLANLYRYRRQYKKAEDTVEQGLNRCLQVQELRLLKKALENKATVSACMIVKDEEEFLPNCLDSIRNWVDEIIVVDTGSTDRTVEVARSYGAKVFFREWDGDFSAPRNLSLSRAACEWIFVIDADEEFVEEDLPLIRRALNREEYRVVSINVINADRATGAISSFLPSNRFFRKSAGFRYEGIVHNQLKINKDERILRVDVRLKHYGYNLPGEKLAQKIARSRALLEKQLAENPDDAFVHFNYAQLLRSSTPEPDDELCELILKHARRAVELSDTDPRGTLHTHLQAHHQQITTLIHQGKLEEAIALCRRALELRPDYLDALFSMAESYGRMGEYEQAEHYFLKYLETQADYVPSQDKLSLIQIYAFARYKAYYWLGLIKQNQKKPEEAENYFLKTLEETEPFGDTYLGLANIYLDRKEFEKALVYIDKQLESRSDSDLGHLYKARYHGLKKEFADAERYLDRAIALTKGNAEVYERAGVYWANKGNFEKALPILENLVRMKPGYGHGLKLLSKAYYDTGDFERSRTLCEKYLEIVPDDAEAINDMANCHFKLGDFERAEQAFARALAVNENLVAVYRNLGLTKLRLGKAEEALALLEDYIKISPGDLETELAVAGIYSRFGDYVTAIQHYERFLIGNAQSVEGLFGSDTGRSSR